MRSDEMILYYKNPAHSWEEILPIGNGHLGAMIWGGVQEEMLGLNEESIWSGFYQDKNNPQAPEGLQEARRALFAGKYKEADLIVRQKMLGGFNENYLPLGNLLLHFAHEEKPQNYIRELNLERSVAKVSYDCGGCHFEREYFASNPAKAILIRLSADAPVLSMKGNFESQLVYKIEKGKGSIAVHLKCPEHMDPRDLGDRSGWLIQGTKGMDVEAGIKILSCDGMIGDGLEIDKATECVILIWAVRKPIVKKNTDYYMLQAEHIRDYQNLFKRVELYLGPQKQVPTDERLNALREGHEDNGLYALYFQYGRYLLISSSREDGLPPNLQGIWTWEFRAPWSSNWTTNINLEMNYWPALSCNLHECETPYFHFMKKVCDEGKKTALINYNCRGFVAHHNLDYWCNTNPVGLAPGENEGTPGCLSWAFWPMGGAWLCLELYRAYEYSLDLNFLRELAYPIIREAALFLLDWLVEWDGMYVTCPSTSPENYFRASDGTLSSLTIGSTMDMTIVRELFVIVRKCCQVLGLKDEVLEEIEGKEKRIAPYRIGSFGQLLEWQEEFEEFEPGHRHLSHLFGLFPGELFIGDKELMESCRVALEHRLKNGGGHTGWSCAWIINLFAALGDGENAYKYLRTLLSCSTYSNLWDAHPPFQIDGNFGGTAAIANMLVQDRGGKVTLLPALPKQFSEGYVKGLCIKNGKAVDISWKDGHVVQHRIYKRQ